MGDQAEKLRAIVATTGKADCSVSKEEWEELTRPDPEHAKYLAKLGRIAETEAVLKRYFWAEKDIEITYPAPVDPVDYRKLWEGLKAELDFDATHHDLDMVELGEDRGKVYKTDDSLQAQAFLDRMEQAETLARFKGGA